MTPVGILLAAGRGRRFDPSGLQNKLLQTLPGGDVVVVASARTLLAVLPRVIAVVRPSDALVAQALRALGCDVTVCMDADSGMAASLVHGISYSLPSAQSWLIALGDMPYVQTATLRSLCAALAAGAASSAPVCDGRRGNPVGFDRTHLAALLALTGDSGARSILQMHRPTEVAVSDRGVLHDVDTPEQLQAP